MKIAYLHQYFVTPEMGGATRSYELARRLVAAGHEVHMITSDQNPSPDQELWRQQELDGINVYWTPVPYNNELDYQHRMTAFLRFAWRASRKATEFDIDVVFATSTPLTIILPAVWTAWRVNIPIVFEVRDLWPSVPIAIGVLRNRLVISAARWLERFAYSKATRIVALAPGMKEAIVESGAPQENVIVIPNGCDLEFFGSSEERGQKLRRKHEWLGKRKMVLFFGTLGFVNGVDYLIRLAAETRRIDPQVRFVVLGDGKMEPELRSLGAEFGVLDKNLYMMGRVAKREVAAWLAASDMSIALFSGPSVVWKDATQNKFFDSLAAGRPVANNFDGWQSQVAQTEECGLILNPDDVAVAAKQLYEKLSNEAWLNSAGRKARELAEGRFDRDKQARELERVLFDAVCDTR